ncbi:MAG TPA: hypothetical protein VN905_07375, partial [Candidatus Binatia bacterium]|nr:hypothetical protein [Candidatus Binatia bacterium]
IKKNCDLDRARRVVQDCRDAGIMVRTYFVLGFPGETREQIQETLDFAADIATDWSNFHIAAPLVGTEMYEQMLDRGDIDSTFNWDGAFFRERQFDTAEIGAEDLKNTAASANLRINFFGNYNLRHGHYERALRLYEDILERYPDHMAAQYCIGLVHRMMGDENAFRAAIEKCKGQLVASQMAQEHLQLHPELFPELAGDLVSA